MVLVYWGDENGWWFGAAGSAQGWFPESYVEVHYNCDVKYFQKIQNILQLYIVRLVLNLFCTFYQ